MKNTSTKKLGQIVSALQTIIAREEARAAARGYIQQLAIEFRSKGAL